MRLLKNKNVLLKYSRDRSPYVVKPSIVAVPKSERDVIKIVNYAKERSLQITARGAGSNLSGSALGKGIIIDFSKMNRIKKISKNRIIVEPGVIFQDINKAVRGFFLPYSPSSGAFCTIGGNVATKAAGLRSVKYGSVDAFVRRIRFVDAQGRVIDTGRLPPDLKGRIMALRRKILSDKRAMRLLRQRAQLKTSSGYNILAFLRHKTPEDIATHLLVGSVGTLGLFTEIELELARVTQGKITCLAYFKSLKSSGDAVLHIRRLNPSAIEIMDAFSLDILKRKSAFSIPEKAESALLIEFDSNLNKAHKSLETLLKKYAIKYDIESDPAKQKSLWNVRSSLLTLVEEEKKNVVAFVEDVGVPPEHLAGFIRDMENIFIKNGVEAVIFGHAGEGNLHMRPVIPRKNWKRTVRKIATACFAAAFKYGGTVTAEHGTGRNKAPFMRKEWGNAVYNYFREIKNIFDLEGLLNPDIMFSDDDITKGMHY